MRSFLAFGLAMAAHFKPGCLLKHCGKQAAAAMTDPNFVKMGICEEGCQKIYNEDTTPMKLHYQNCTTTCSVSYESPKSDTFMACAMQYNCMVLDPVGKETKCPFPEVDPESSLQSLAGEWWQHRGYNALWDCYSCQHIHSMKMVNDSAWCAQTVGPAGPVKAPCWAYTYSYDLYVEGGETKYFGQTWQLPNIAKGKPIDFYYEYMGTAHNETWYLLKAAENYVLLQDCSYMLGWTNVGSIVWVRPGYSLTAQDDADIKQVYKEKLGWEYDDFCYNRHGSDQCQEPALGTRVAKPPRRPAFALDALRELAKASPAAGTIVV